MKRFPVRVTTALIKEKNTRFLSSRENDLSEVQRQHTISAESSLRGSTQSLEITRDFLTLHCENKTVIPSHKKVKFWCFFYSVVIYSRKISFSDKKFKDTRSEGKDMLFFSLTFLL